MTTWGVTSTGFVKKALTDIVSDLQAAFRSQFGQSIDVSSGSVYGQIIGIIAERYADLWDALQSVYDGFSPDGSVGAALDVICGLTGTTRTLPTYSLATCMCSGTPGTVIPAGSVASVSGTGTRWASTTSVTIGGGGTVSAVFQSVNSGPVIATAGTLNTIATPVAGWSSVTNPTDATLGIALETDQDLRVKREQELALGGKAALDSVRAHLLAEIAGVTAVTVFDNPTDVTNTDGVPPHSFETLVSGSGFADADIWANIWTNKPGGIRAYGGIAGTTLDSEGNSQPIAYSKPTEVDVYIVANVTVDQTKWPSDGVTQVKNALLAYGIGAYLTGKDAVASALEAQCFAVSGMLDTTCLLSTVDLAHCTTRATVPISIRQFAKLDSSRIQVNVTYGVP